MSEHGAGERFPVINPAAVWRKRLMFGLRLAVSIGLMVAISAMNGHRLDGMVLNVHRARDYSDLASLRAAIVRARNERIQ